MKLILVVEVTLSGWLRSLDWYWFAGFILTLAGLMFVLGNGSTSKRKKRQEAVERSSTEEGRNRRRSVGGKGDRITGGVGCVAAAPYGDDIRAG